MNRTRVLVVDAHAEVRGALAEVVEREPSFRLVGVAADFGSALEHANQDITTCNFPVPPEFGPDGKTNWVFRVTGFFH